MQGCTVTACGTSPKLPAIHVSGPNAWANLEGCYISGAAYAGVLLHGPSAAALLTRCDLEQCGVGVLCGEGRGKHTEGVALTKDHLKVRTCVWMRACARACACKRACVYIGVCTSAFSCGAICMKVQCVCASPNDCFSGGGKAVLFQHAILEVQGVRPVAQRQVSHELGSARGWGGGNVPCAQFMLGCVGCGWGTYGRAGPLPEGGAIGCKASLLG